MCQYIWTLLRDNFDFFFSLCNAELLHIAFLLSCVLHVIFTSFSGRKRHLEFLYLKREVWWDDFPKWQKRKTQSLNYDLEVCKHVFKVNFCTYFFQVKDYLLLISPAFWKYSHSTNNAYYKDDCSYSIISATGIPVSRIFQHLSLMVAQKVGGWNTRC